MSSQRPLLLCRSAAHLQLQSYNTQLKELMQLAERVSTQAYSLNCKNLGSRSTSTTIYRMLLQYYQFGAWLYAIIGSQL